MTRNGSRINENQHKLMHSACFFRSSPAVTVPMAKTHENGQKKMTKKLSKQCKNNDRFWGHFHGFWPSGPSRLDSYDFFASFALVYVDFRWFPSHFVTFFLFCPEFLVTTRQFFCHDLPVTVFFNFWPIFDVFGPRDHHG